MPEAPCHVNPGARLRLQRVVAQRQLRLALVEVQDGGHRGGVLGKLLALGEADRDRGEPCGSTPPTPPCVRVRTRRFDPIKRSRNQPSEEGRPSRSTRCAAPVGPPGDRTCATPLWVSRRLPPPQTQTRRDVVVEQSGSALSATAATGTCAVADVSTHRDWTTPAAFDRSQSSPASRSSSEPTARSTWSGSPRVSDTSVPGFVP